MSDLQDLIHRNAQLAYEQGVKNERERIVKLLEPFAQHDKWCYIDGKLICYPEDCDAKIFAWTIRLILKTDQQENLHERTNNPLNGDAEISDAAKSERTHEL